MILRALGVNAAYDQGRFTRVLEYEFIEAIIRELKSRKGEIPFDEFAQWLRSEAEAKAFESYHAPYQSNFLIEMDSPGKNGSAPWRMLFDAGHDVRHSLAEQGLDHNSISAVKITHTHGDHVAGLDYLAIRTIFDYNYGPPGAKAKWISENDPHGNSIIAAMVRGNRLPDEFKPDIIGHESVLRDVWSALKPLVNTLEGVRNLELETYFNRRPFTGENDELEIRDGEITWTAFPVATVHVYSGAEPMNSYGLYFKAESCPEVYLLSDSQLPIKGAPRAFMDTADIIFMDVETGGRSGVHPHMDDVRSMFPERIKRKMILYHYSSLPETEPGEFKHVCRAGDVFEFSPAGIRLNGDAL